MIGRPNIDLKRAIKYSWIATNISLFQLGLGSYVLYPDRVVPNNDAAFFLILLSFPSSLPTVALAVSMIDVDRSYDYFIICSVAFISGYLQWFWCVPRIFRQPDIIRLQLSNPPRATQPTLVAKSTPRAKSKRASLRRVPFDKSGQSPLERAIGIKRRYN